MTIERTPFSKENIPLQEREKELQQILQDVNYRTKEYDSFCEAFLRPISGDFLKQYAQKRETFDAERFRIQPRVSWRLNSEEMRTRPRPEWIYEEEFSTDIEEKAILEAPFAYTLEYETSSGNWQVLSIIGFRPDFERKILLLDQLQGVSSVGKDAKTYKESRRARMKITSPDSSMLVSPEHILYDAARALAKAQGMKYIGLRKSAYNKYREIHQRRLAYPEGARDTIYDRVSKDRQHRILQKTAYTFERIE